MKDNYIKWFYFTMFIAAATQFYVTLELMVVMLLFAVMFSVALIVVFVLYLIQKSWEKLVDRVVL
jgi:hypothetical protein